MQRSQYSEESSPADNKLDEEFIKLMIDIEKNYTLFKKHDKIRIEQWCKKLCQITINPTWKQNRNNYALLLLNSINNANLVEPFNKVPPEGSLPALNTHIVVNKRINQA